MLPSINSMILLATTCYQAIACLLEDRHPPPGKLIDVGGYNLHLYTAGESGPTVVIDHSLGGIEGYLLLPEIAKLTKVCIYDRAGYGWSDHSPYPRTSQQIVTELDCLLTQAGIEPPYILVGNSFGSYNVRLYAKRFPHKVIGMVLTDGLHETGMLKMPINLQCLKYFFLSGFVMSFLGSVLGIVRLLKLIGTFELIKRELAKFPKKTLKSVKRSFCRPKHWITMSREILNLDNSSRQVQPAKDFGELPIINIKANTFFHPSFWTLLLPGKAANDLRDKMHDELMNLSTNSIQIQTDRSSHFVWIDQPELIVKAILHIVKSCDRN
ncbi:alpha/beta hydrolase [Calothrix sp. FACHB-1219]|uniref:alpha/beta hydrolase n=1 Tax=unclassified Calothrix TaxID=2619626 RepID=UPI00168958F0|nr:MULTISPECIES: alpha/beta hydrolase [unclassified Calothrix]MBD2205850.1 alpha/beta hydrolase [Calothrix sp. FACHB-168]MBD2220679.1 alpha/beta hydrolase [Calothrix sp. FACHB-1219]